MKRELLWLVLAWLVLAFVSFLVSRPDLPVPGVYYDEAVYGHLAKDVLMDCNAEPHMPGSQTVELFGRPFPLFVQGYLGAVKCWMLLPFFAVFGPSAAVMRSAMLAWTLLGLLFFMLWTWRLLGLRAAVLAGFLLGLDPAFLFFSVWELGSVVPSFICRFAGFFFALAWWRTRRGLWLFLAGFAFGLGFFNKIDFVLILLGSGLALLAIYGKELLRTFRRSLKSLAIPVAGFVIGAAPALWYSGRMIEYILGGVDTQPNEIAEKIKTLCGMLDGSYAFGVMARGGDLQRPSPGWTALFSPFALTLILAFFFTLSRVLRAWRTSKTEQVSAGSAGDSAPQSEFQTQSDYTQLSAFFLLSTVLILLFTWLLPDATRLHHWTLVYPFPHLLIAISAIRLWEAGRSVGKSRCFSVASKSIAVAAVLAVISSHTVALIKTHRLVMKTGGSGLWSSSLDAFAAQVRTRSDLTIVSMDWGFQEQLAFLTNGPRLLEPIWQMQSGIPLPISTATNYIYLVHPFEYRMFFYGDEVLQMARRRDPATVSIQEHKDRLGRTAFLSIQFLRE